jgi:flagellar biosynthesis/type III secretory pathway protein FliH
MARVIRASAVISEAERILAAARAEAERVVGAAQDEADARRASLRAELEREVREEVGRELREEAARRRAELEEEARAERAAASIAAADSQALRARERDVAALAVAVAEHLVKDAIEARPERVRGLVSDALDRVRRASMVRVRVSPDDLASLRLPEGVEVASDAAIARGGCVVESDLGELDARIETRLDALLRALRSQGASRG